MLASPSNVGGRTRGRAARLTSAACLLLCLTALPAGSKAAAPYPSSAVIDTVLFTWSTHVRRAPGSDNWPLTWSDNDHQYAPFGDGGGFAGTNDLCRVSLGVTRVEGSATSHIGVDVWGYPSCAENPANVDGKSYAILSAGGTLYLWYGPSSGTSNLDYQRLLKSTNHGASWTYTGVEFTYATHRIGLFGFLQFVKDNQGARDSYVYIYATVLKSYAWGTQTPGELMLIRVPNTGLENASLYQFYAGKDAQGNPRWGTFAERVPVFTDPNGVVVPSAIYNSGLRRYILVTHHSNWSSGNLGIFDAPEPWGPWTTAAYFTAWPAGGQVERSAFYGNFSPKWWSNGGKDFVYVFTGIGANDSWNSVRGSFVTTLTGAPLSASAPPVQDEVRGAVPNPFNPRTDVRFSLAAGRPGPYRLDVFDASGRWVARIAEGVDDGGGGLRSIAWEAIGRQGEPLASGLYLLRLQTTRGSTTGKMTLLR